MNLSDIFLSNGRISPVLILWAFYIAVVIGTIVYYLTNAQLGKLVANLIDVGACSPETAVKLIDIELSLNVWLKLCLRMPTSYKNLLVAITPDGKYYANAFFTDEPPIFRELKAITRKRKSRTDGKKNAEEPELITAETAAPIDSTELKTDEILPLSDTKKPEKINFDPLSVKYYIPKEVHDKVKGIYKKPKVKILYLILLLIGFGVLMFLASVLLQIIINSLPSI